MVQIRGALGLRGRIAGVVLLSAVVTLAVAAIALLGPLEHSLRRAELQTLRTQIGRRPTLAFQRLPLCTIFSNQHGEQIRLARAEAQLSSVTGNGIVTVLASPTLGGASTLPRPGPPSAANPVPGSAATLSDVVAAFRGGRDTPFVSTATIGGTEYAVEAIRFTMRCSVGNGNFTVVPYVLAVRKSIAELPAVARVVRRAFFDAALAALALTLLLGIPLSGRLVRRLRRLREVAVDVQHDAPMLVPVDTANDEVGDLARALASMQQRLQSQEQARRSFVATASHELRTPLASLDGMLELLGEDLADEAPDVHDARALLDRARAQSRRLGRLAADLLDLSRIDAQVLLRSEPVELGELSRAVLAEFELGSAERRIQSSLHQPDGHAVWALGDPGSIARILRILLDNAIRASPPDTHVTVTLDDHRGARISVCDEGPGVPVEERETIFERFSRGKDTAGQAGFGLGLAIGRELAQRMGGELVLEASGDPDGPGPGGCGARFTLSLPAAHAPAGEPLAVD